jgi:hypothetical protein
MGEVRAATDVRPCASMTPWVAGDDRAGADVRRSTAGGRRETAQYSNTCSTIVWPQRNAGPPLSDLCWRSAAFRTLVRFIRTAWHERGHIAGGEQLLSVADMILSRSVRSSGSSNWPMIQQSRRRSPLTPALASAFSPPVHGVGRGS